MVAREELDLKLPGYIAVSWRDETSGSWCEVEVCGPFLNWIIFRAVKPMHRPLMPVPKLTSIYDVPQCFEDVYGIIVKMPDLERAVQNYRRRTTGNEGRWRVSR